VNDKLDLTLETLEAFEAPLSDREAGIIVGAAFGVGVLAGIGLAILIT
jgi:hypothetical protein